MSKGSKKSYTIHFMFMNNGKMLLKLIAYGVLFMVLTGCATWTKIFPPSHQQKPAAPTRQQHVDAKAQQQYYDEGLQQYSKDNYGEAKAAFQQVVDLGPNTTLGLKAQENLRKIEQILKTLEEIEAK
jgi:outer membrane protein assembly factor BamD (BamD/ComL family)